MFFPIESPSRSPQFEIKEEDAHNIKRIYFREREIYENKIDNINFHKHNFLAIVFSVLFGMIIAFAMLSDMEGLYSSGVKTTFTLVVGAIIGMIPYAFFYSFQGDEALKEFRDNHEMEIMNEDEIYIISKAYKLFYSSNIPIADISYKNGNTFIKYRLIRRIMKRLDNDTIIKAK